MASPSANPSPLYRLLLRRWGVSLVLMGVSFVLFGLASLHLLQLLHANLGFLWEHGFDAVQEGALRQLVELGGSGFVAAICYIAFKLCEKALVERLSVDNNNNPKGSSL